MAGFRRLGYLGILAGLIAAVSCFSDPEGDSSSGSSSSSGLYSGSLAAGNFILSYRSANSWEQGMCVNMTLGNYGPPLDYWSVQVQLEGDVTGWLSFDGAYIVPNYDVLTITPIAETSLDFGEELDMMYCAEPALLPIGIMDYDAAESDPTPDPGMSSLDSGPLVMTWRSYGQSFGGTCLELIITNVTTDYILWSKIVSNLDVGSNDEGGTELRDFWGVTAVLENSYTLTLYPGQGEETLEPFEFTTGTVCLDPEASPRDMEAWTAEWVQESDVQATPEAPTPTPEPDASPTPTPAPLLPGMISDGTYDLYYKYLGYEKNGGDCFEYQLMNMDGSTATYSAVDVQMTDGAVITDQSGSFKFQIDPLEQMRMTMVPANGAQTLEPYSVATGEVCLTPSAVPSSMQVSP